MRCRAQVSGGEIQLVTALDRYGAFVDRAASPTVGEGPLTAVRLAVKDNIAVAGLKWTCGLPLLEGRVADADALCVARLRAAGATVVGTTVTDSAGFGMMTPGVINPIAHDRTAGGSSGGSAAAVAGGLADLALGTDTGGSVRTPAACCGLYGLKPTYGRVPVGGVTPLSWAFDHVGLIAADLDILTTGWKALAADDVPPRTGQIRRVGFDPSRMAMADDTIRQAIEEVLARLERDGFRLQEIRLPDLLEIAQVHGAVVCGEALEIWREHWPRQAELFTVTSRKSLGYAESLDPAEVAQARIELSEIRKQIAGLFDTVDAIIGPTLAVEPPKIGAQRVDMAGNSVPVIFAMLSETCTFNVSGHPALSVPLAALTHCGVPVSMQIATPPAGELAAIGLARQIAGLDLLA